MLKRRQLYKFGMRGSEAGCFTWPRGLAVGPDNSIVVADSSNHRVQVISFSKFPSKRNFCRVREGSLEKDSFVARVPVSKVSSPERRWRNSRDRYVTFRNLQVFDCNGNFMKEFGTYGSGEGEFDCLAGVAVNRIGQYIIADRYNHRIQVLDPSGRFLRAFGSQGTADGRFNYPWGITTDALGFIYVCDKENHRVQVRAFAILLFIFLSVFLNCCPGDQRLKRHRRCDNVHQTLKDIASSPVSYRKLTITMQIRC